MATKLDKYRNGTISDPELDEDLKTVYLQWKIQQRLETLRPKPQTWWQKNQYFCWGIAAFATCVVTGWFFSRYSKQQIKQLQMKWEKCHPSAPKEETLTIQLQSSPQMVFDFYAQQDYRTAIKVAQELAAAPTKQNCLSEAEIKQLLWMLRVVKVLSWK